ncbi:putative uncharacterized protein [Ruminococcus sp. CAG:624]|nr:hypothetical protein [Ruminococcus sp.]CDF03201.1 putative uncharacterized protein [Ruminococcus sp. CAG:624]
MTGTEIKSMIKASGLRLWQVAQALGINDGNFSRRLRRAFNEAEVEKIKSIINELNTQKSET